MLALWIILGILALLGLMGCIPLGVTAIYDAAGPEVTARIGPVRLRLYPRVEKPKKAKQEKKPPTAEKKPDESPAPEGKKSLGGALPMFRELLGLVLEAQADLRSRLRIRDLTLQLNVGGKGDDPAKSAMLYGSAWTAIGTLMPLLERAFRIEARDVRANVDFLTEETTVYARAEAVISVGAILRMAGYYGVRGLKLYRKFAKKGGNNNGTSNQ